jgi:hypothetical protein
MCRGCHSARGDLLLTLLMCINKPILDKTISALGVDTEPHRQTPGLCFSVCPLCGYSDASGDSMSLAVVGFGAAAATRSPLVRDPPHYFLSIGETRRSYADCCSVEEMYVPMRLYQIKPCWSRRVQVCRARSAIETRSPCALATSIQTFDEGCASPSHSASITPHQFESTYTKHRHRPGKRVS